MLSIGALAALAPVFCVFGHEVRNLDTAGSLAVESNGEWSLSLGATNDDEPFLSGGHPSIAIPRLNASVKIQSSSYSSGSDAIGSYTSIIHAFGASKDRLLAACSQRGAPGCDVKHQAAWYKFVSKLPADGTVLETHFRTYSDRHHFALVQVYPNGLPAAPASDVAALRNRLSGDLSVSDVSKAREEALQGAAAAQCPGLQYLPNMDQSDGKLVSKVSGTKSDGECCDAAMKADVEVWVRDPNDGDCFLINGATGFFPRIGRTVGVLKPLNTTFEDATNSPIAVFPLVSNAETPSTGPGSPAGIVYFAGCQLSASNHVTWAGNPDIAGDGIDGMPSAVHDLQGRTVVFGPMDNFLVALHSRSEVLLPDQTTVGGQLGMGIRASVDKELPPGFQHGTLFVSGQGIMRTLEQYGAALMSISGKQPIPYSEDPMLSRLTFWQDHGAWGYHNPANWSNMQEQDLDQKRGWLAADLPFRAVQWDDWWMYLPDHDFNGMTYWWPRPDVFPSGLTDWMGIPLSLYNPGYMANNIYDNTTEARARYGYDWRRDAAGQAIPVGKGEFYRDIFANGTKARGIMFEQDFLCSINQRTNLTNSDLSQGADWLEGMSQQAAAVNWTLQLCMSNPAHALESTRMPRATNMRATRDNTHSDATNGLVLGYSAMLIRAVGMYASRDNVWSTNNQSGCSEGSCSQPEVGLQNTFALLAGGPYGPSDAPYRTNASLVMRTCRKDGVLLKGDKPLVATDTALLTETRNALEKGKGIDPVMVWSTYSDIALDGAAGAGTARHTYVLGVNLDNATALGLSELQPHGDSSAGGGQGEFLAWDAWAAMNAAPAAAAPSPVSLHVVTEDNPLVLPSCPAPADPALLNHRYFAAAPVLDGGWVYLGETGKIAAASSRRVQSIAASAHELQVGVSLSPLESASMRVVAPQDTEGLLSAARAHGRGGYEVMASNGTVGVQVQCTAACSPSAGTLPAMWARDPMLPDVDCPMVIRCQPGGAGGATCTCEASI